MKKLAILTIVAAFCASMAACNKDTKLAITNGSNSANKVNDIVWADNDATWNSTTGYEIGTTTDSKEVGTTKGSIAASVFNGTDYDVATVTKDGTSDSSFVLSEGSSNTVTIKAVKAGTANKE
jgi:hypothetical protein